LSIHGPILDSFARALIPLSKRKLEWVLDPSGTKHFARAGSKLDP
jgi:hypothetical protein